jgi:pantetheine-phosphate adenylyltransferase
LALSQILMRRDDIMTKKVVGVYAGSFDPITRGHLDLVRKACPLVDELHIAVGTSPRKGHGMFTPDERVSLIRGAIAEASCDHIKVTSFSGLLVDYCHEVGATYVFRGIRAFKDFDAEFEMHLVNVDLNPRINYIYLMPHPEFQHVSSSTVRELAFYGHHELTKYVTKNVNEALAEKARRH